MHVDLSATLSPATPVYPGDPAVMVKPAGRLEHDGWSDHVLSLGTHVGTHIDAPAHMIAGGKTLDAYPIGHFIGRGVYVDVRAGYDLSAIKRQHIASGDIVLFHTGMNRRYHEAAYWTDFEPVPEPIARYLVEKRINLLGFDMCGPDTQPFPIHKILLENDVLIAENLTNLEALAGRSFTVHALPLRLDLDGAPARVVAHITN